MKPLLIKAQLDTPEIEFNPESNVLKMSGISHPENAKDFYQRLLDWLDEYFVGLQEHLPKRIVVDLNFRYLNTSSYRYLSEILRKIAKHARTQIPVEVIWNYLEEDEDMLMEGVDLCELPDVKLPYRCVPYS